MALVTGAELRRLLNPYYLVNLLLAACFPVLRLVRPFCDVLFPGGDCQLDFRETEILTFVAVVVLFRTRKTGVVRLLPYLSTACMYAKVGHVHHAFKPLALVQNDRYASVECSSAAMANAS